MSTENWVISHASLRGTSHKGNGLPCQDSIRHAVCGEWFIGVVSDGAGSATKSHFGSRLVADTVVAGLEHELSGTGGITEFEQLEILIHQVIGHARSLLQKRLQAGESLRDYHCTLVGIVAGERGGVFFHVGDGLGMAGACNIDSASRTVSYWSRTSLSLPENGEYANETYFVTQRDWEAHLRFKVVNFPQDIVILASDGPMSLLLQNGRPNNGFIDVVLEYLGSLDSGRERDSYIKKVLSASQVDAITNDDKSLLVAVRPRVCGLKVKKKSSSSQLLPGKEKSTSERPDTGLLKHDQAPPAQQTRPTTAAQGSGSVFFKKFSLAHGIIALLIAFILGSTLTWLFTRHRTSVAPVISNTIPKTPSVIPEAEQEKKHMSSAKQKPAVAVEKAFPGISTLHQQQQKVKDTSSGEADVENLLKKKPKIIGANPNIDGFRTSETTKHETIRSRQQTKTY